MEIHEQVKKSVEDFEERFGPPADFNSQNDFSLSAHMVEDYAQKKHHLITSQVALLESVVEDLKNRKTNAWVDMAMKKVYDLAIEDQITYLTEQINKIKEL